jgi:hypothetical protein
VYGEYGAKNLIVEELVVWRACKVDGWLDVKAFRVIIGTAD